MHICVLLGLCCSVYVKVVFVPAMTAEGEVEVHLHPFLSSILGVSG